MLLSDSSSCKKCPCSVFLRRVLFLFASFTEIYRRPKLGLISNPSINFIISCFQTHALVILTRLWSCQKIHTSLIELDTFDSSSCFNNIFVTIRVSFLLERQTGGSGGSLRIEPFWQQQWLTLAHQFEKPKVSFMTIKSTNNW